MNVYVGEYGYGDGVLLDGLLELSLMMLLCRCIHPVFVVVATCHDTATQECHDVKEFSSGMVSVAAWLLLRVR